MRSLREQNVPPKSYSVSVPQTYENQTAGRQRTLSLRCKLFKSGGSAIRYWNRIVGIGIACSNC
jgi:hypothetical protein